jgi:cytochrome c oxidase subunit 4
MKALAKPRRDRSPQWRGTLRAIAAAWLALVALLLVSLGSAYLSLGSGNLWIGLGVAAVKTAIVLWAFMRIGEAQGVVRLAAAIGVFMLAILFVLGGIDDRTQPADPAAWTHPTQIEPLVTPPAKP